MGQNGWNLLLDAIHAMSNSTLSFYSLSDWMVKDLLASFWNAKLCHWTLGHPGEPSLFSIANFCDVDLHYKSDDENFQLKARRWWHDNKLSSFRKWKSPPYYWRRIDEASQQSVSGLMSNSTNISPISNYHPTLCNVLHCAPSPFMQIWSQGRKPKVVQTCHENIESSLCFSIATKIVFQDIPFSSLTKCSSPKESSKVVDGKSHTYLSKRWI